MNTITILGTLFGLIGIIFTYYSICRFKRPCQFTCHYQDQYCSGDFLEDFKDLNEKHKDISITAEFKYLKVFLHCSGQDLNSNNNIIKIILPSGFRWFDFSISSSNQEINPRIEKDLLNDDTAILTFDSIRHDESINIKAIIKQLAENNQHKDFDLLDFSPEELSFEHRIKDTDDINFFEDPNEINERIKTIRGYIMIAFLIASYFLLKHFKLSYWFLVPFGIYFAGCLAHIENYYKKRLKKKSDKTIKKLLTKSIIDKTQE